MNRLIVCFFLVFCGTMAFSKGLEIHHLRVDDQSNPRGIHHMRPFLSWELKGNVRDIHQGAYQILVSDQLELLAKNQGTIWDSGKQSSDQSIQVPYAGKSLITANTYYWKVKVWDLQGQESEWSEPAQWQMGLLTQADWKGAEWIAYEALVKDRIDPLPKADKKDTYQENNILPMLRTSFQLNKEVAEATLFISGLGHFEAHINGQKLGDHFLDAGWTKYDKEALYESFDVRELLKKGENAIGVLLGNGFYYIPPVKGRYRKQKVAFGYPKMLARLRIIYQDGSEDNVVSDQNWKTDRGPITFSSIYGGEDYDARLEQPGWDRVGFDDRKWKPVIVVDGSPELNPQLAEPLKVMQRFKPIQVTKSSQGWVYDFGQNASGIVELKVKGKRGDVVRIYPGELLDKGAVTQKASGGPYYFEYVLKGDGEEIWTPRFSYYGFRYAEVRGGVPVGKGNGGSAPLVVSISSLHTRNAAPRVGMFNSSNELFNKTNALIDWAIKSNMASVFTDCPHREKLGWLEETHLMGASICYNYDVATLFRKAIQDMKYSQLPNGLVPEIAPEYVEFNWGGDMFRDSPEWGSACILLPWYLYTWYGDQEIIREAYPMMRKYLEYLGTRAEHHLLKQGLGDWYDLGPKPPGVSQLTPMGVTGTAIYYHDLRILAQMAKMLGHTEDKKAYESLAEQVKIAFNQAFFNPTTKEYATGSQTANAMAVYMELVDSVDKEAVVQNLIKDIRDRGNSLTAGDIGYRYVLRVLEQEGHSDVIYDMNSRTDVPGYGYQLAKGATALTESWQGLATVSNNHLMLGHLMEWFYSGIAGIRQEEGSVAFKNIVIYPELVGDITQASGSYHSAYGEITSSWKKEGDRFVLDLSIPANTSAKIYLPLNEGQQVWEGNRLWKEQPLVQETVPGRAIVHIGSGNYHFVLK